MEKIVVPVVRRQSRGGARFYISVFKDSKLGGMCATARKATTLTAGGRLGDDRGIRDQRPDVVALNGGPRLSSRKRFVPGVLRDAGRGGHYWERLIEGGDEKAQQCGWLKDKFGSPGRSCPQCCPR